MGILTTSIVRGIDIVMRRRIERLGLAEDTVAGLQGAGIVTAGQLFEASPLALMSACDLDLNGR